MKTLKLSEIGIWLIGAGGFARCIVEVVHANGGIISGIVTDGKSDTSWFVGDTILEEDFLKSTYNGHITFGIGTNYHREYLYKIFTERQPTLRPISLRHPESHIASTANLALGSVIMAGSVIGPFTSIGLSSVFYSGAIVEHDSKIGDFVTLAPNACTGGNVSIGSRSFIGVGASIAHNVVIGHDTIIGAGAVVINDIPPLCVAVGNPAKVIRYRKWNENYL